MRHCVSSRMSQPVYETTTAPSRSRASRFAFSEAGHSVTSGLSWLAGILHLVWPLGSSGTETAGRGDDENGLHANPKIPTNTTKKRIAREFLARSLCGTQ